MLFSLKKFPLPQIHYFFPTQVMAGKTIIGNKIEMRLDDSTRVAVSFMGKVYFCNRPM